MFDDKIEKVTDKIVNKVRTAIREEVYNCEYIYIKPLNMKLKKIENEFDDLSYKMKIVIGISLGLSLADTILLFAILKKMK